MLLLISISFNAINFSKTHILMSKGQQSGFKDKMCLSFVVKSK